VKPKRVRGPKEQSCNLVVVDAARF